MQIAFHLGVHSTDEDRLVRGLARDREALAGLGIGVPQPGRYRPLLREALSRLHGGTGDAELQETLLDAALERDEVERVLFSHEFFLCIPKMVVSDGGFYRMAGRKVAALANVFHGHEIEFHMALQDPATLIPALMGRVDGQSYETFMGDVTPRDLLWRPVVEDILSSVPDARIVLWCNEDTPLIWPEVLRRSSGAPEEMPLAADYDMAERLMTGDGLARLKDYMGARPGMSPEQRAKVTSAFLAKFADASALEIAVDLPGWDQALIDDLSDRYEDEVAEIAALPGVEFIAA